MWIRTQDKETLLNVNCIDVYNLNKNEWIIEACGNDLGTYNSKERALEVLDEIQERIERKRVFVDEYGDIRVKRKDNAKVYEMPEK